MTLDAMGTTLDVAIDGEREAVSTDDSTSTANPFQSTLARFTESAAVRWYLDSLERNPLQTKCWTSCTGFMIGDITAQLLTEPDFVLSRTLILAGYGFFIDAPAGNAFYVRCYSTCFILLVRMTGQWGVGLLRAVIQRTFA
jgi:hypothetical protein